MMKKILGLDLGTNSIGWAMVNEAQNEKEKSSIIKIGSRIIHYGDNLVKVDKSGKISESRSPIEEFQSGKGLSPNAGRTKQRSARRNLQRYKLRRENLISILKEHSIIDIDSVFSEVGNHSTFKTYRNRALAASKEITLDEFVRVLFMINKKRGYKSSRKSKGEDEGHLIDGMAIAMQLYEKNQTPGQFYYALLKSGKKSNIDFYRSDLQAEFDKIWNFQKQFYSDVLTAEAYEKLKGQKKGPTSQYFEKVLKILTPEIKGKWDEKKLKRFELRNNAICQQLKIGEIAECLIEINNEIHNSSGYLGAIGDRSKELVFKKLTVGQFLYSQIESNPNASLKKQIFYRQDYLDEFNSLWDEQSKYHKQLTADLKAEIRDVIIFYQRKLKSQKGLISFCEFESKPIEIVVDGKKKIKTRGIRVIPRSSPLFQEFKIWQILNNIEITNTQTKQTRELTEDEKNILFEELNVKAKISKKEALKLLFNLVNEYDLNYKEIQGNETNAALYEAYQKIIVLTGHEEKDCTKLKSREAKEFIKEIFISQNIKQEILEFDSSLEGSNLEKQLHFQLWHLLYSYEGDNTNLGNEKLILALKNKFGFEREYAQIMLNVSLLSDFGSLSAKAIRKILPHLKDGFSYGGRKDRPLEPSAVEYAGYKTHSKSSLKKEEIESKVYKDKLNVLPKNSLRNPIVEKILNQTINVVNAAIEEFGKPDEIRIELARELKKSADERKKMTEAITKSAADHDKYRKILQAEFGLKHVSRNDLIRYKLYLELKKTGYKTLYSKTYIAPNKLFSKEFDIEHILPKAKLFDDSFSNKTLELKSINLEKADMTAYDFVKLKYGEEELINYEKRVNDLYFKKNVEDGVIEITALEGKNSDMRISKTKRDKLLMPESKIPSGFIDRELRNTQYIAKKAKEMLEEICNEVLTTTGSVTERLREDWQLIDIMQELNWNKYDALGLTEEFTNKDGKVIKRIKDWTKRNDQRHHAMDAITVAFTKRSHIQYLNNLNARSNKDGSIYGIEQKELYRDKNNRLRFKPPMPIVDFREESKRQLENTLISFKANNKVVTKNNNKFKGKDGLQIKTELTPRGQLHLETIYGSIKRYETAEIKVNASLDIETINKVAKKKIREALLKRLSEFNNDPKTAFTGKNSLDKNPIFIDQHQSYKIPEKIKIVWQETLFTIRKDISPDLKIEKVVDPKIKIILERRLKEFNGEAKAAFSNLFENPIWLNKEKGISIKRVTISGATKPVPLRNKRDHNGNFLLDNLGNKLPVDFVTTSNNHHVGIYKDENGLLQDNVVSFLEAVERVNQGLPAINKTFNQEIGWSFLFTMKQNESFVFPDEKTGFNPHEIDLFNENNYKIISPNLFVLQTMSKVVYGTNAIRDYKFRHHLETTKNDEKELKDITFKQYKTLSEFQKIVKVRINHLGKIVNVGEY